MKRLIPSDDELHAYVDERLEPVRRAEVQAWLAANPQAAARVEGWRADARRLRTALAGLGELPGAAQLDLGQLRRQLRQRRQRRWAAAAVVMLALGVGAWAAGKCAMQPWRGSTCPWLMLFRRTVCSPAVKHWISRPVILGGCATG